MSCCGNCKFNEWCPDKAEDIKWCIEKSHLNIAYEQGKADAIKELPTMLYYDGFNDGYKALHKEFKDSFEELNRLMCEYFEKWDTRKELTELEKLALHIVTIGMQDLGAFIYKSKDTHEVSF